MKQLCYILTVILVVVAIPMIASAQEIRLEPYNKSGLYLNQQIAADTVANGKLPSRVYVLQRGGLYLSNAVFTNTGNWTLRLKANDSTTTRRPVIMLYPTGTGGSPWNPPGQLFQIQGSLDLKSLIITGYYETVDTNRYNMQGGLINIPASVSGVSITIDSCVLSNSNGNHVRTDGAASVVKVTNSVFANMGYLGRSNLGAGKAFDLRNTTCDSLIIKNNTFVNWLDRIIRHYPNSGATSTGVINYFLFDHNTLVNGTSYHGILSLGSLGNRAIITNNLLVDPFIMGNDTDATRQAEFIPSGELDAYGKARMNWIFSYPNTTTSWTVSNNYYSISDSSQAFYDQFAAAGVTGEGSPLTWHINGRLGADSVNAFKKVNVSMTKIPATMTQLARWYRAANGGKKTKNTPGAWTYGVATDPNDFDRKGYAWLRDTLNCNYNGPASIVSSDGLTVGDTRWTFTTGVANSDEIPAAFDLSQNYPNPFNPSTAISYQLSAVSTVDLRVYDMLGREVAVLASGVQNPGSYTVNFDATTLASGMYMYRLTAGAFSDVKQMILIK